jgi:ribosomal-protein-alanine N-acetyltransferase
MELADVEAVLAVEQAVHAHPWTRGNFVDALAAGYEGWVDEAEGVLRGYAVLMPGVDEAELLTLGVALSSQRQGLASGLLDSLEAQARLRALERLCLEVRPSNLAALALYRKAGFVEVGRRRGYYPAAHGREEAILMEKRL